MNVRNNFMTVTSMLSVPKFLVALPVLVMLASLETEPIVPVR